MKLGLALPTFSLDTGRTLTLSEVAVSARHAEELGFDSAWVMDHFWLENVGRPGVPRVGGHDPLVTLAYAAARTDSITLGTLVICNTFRNTGQLAREAAALADAAPDRLILGLGAGWGESEHDAFGYSFQHRVDRLEETLTVLPSLLRGDKVGVEGSQVQLREADVLVTAPAPPIWLSAFSPRMFGLTARYADGWNTAWHGTDTGRFKRELATLRSELADAGKSERDFTVSVGLWMLPVGGEELERAARRADTLKPEPTPDGWPFPALERTVNGPPERLAATVEEYVRLGAEHVILNMSVTPFSRFDPTYIDRAAEVLRAVKGAGVAR
jgi:alkanesulfonate monooxygenase SsuD/methylene tetrahydromethanopterin reductase-like flavin-dependent oxidoreductase (luciferase family)